MKLFLIVFIALIGLSFAEETCEIDGYDFKNLTRNYWSVESTECSPHKIVNGTAPTVKCFFIFSMCLTPLPSLRFCNKGYDACQVDDTSTQIVGYNSPILIPRTTSKSQTGRISWFYPGAPSLEIVFVCDKTKHIQASDNSMVSTLIATSSKKTSGKDDITFEIPYAGACFSAPPPPPVPSGMGPGTKLLLVLMSAGVIYFGVGCVYRHSQGARGIEMLPHFWFWTNLPSYIADGCVFIIRVITCQSQRRPPVDDYSTATTPTSRNYETL